MNRIKIIALALVLAFSLEQLAFAAPASSPVVVPMKPLNISLPKDVAHIDEVYNGSSVNPRLILIQDAHTNVSGQLNIAEIISELVSEYKVQYVFTEAGMGDNSLSALRSSASKKIRKQIGLEYLRKGRLKGTEYLSLATDLDFKIWGVEDPDLYKNAFESYKFIVEKRDSTLPQLNTLLADSQFLKEKIFNYELRSFDSLRLKYLNEKITVSDYISALETYLNSEEIDTFPAFKKLLEIQKLEKNVRFEKTESERNRFISSFQNFWSGSDIEPATEGEIGSALESIRKKGGELTYQHFKRKLELLIASGKITAGSFRSEYPDLSAYIEYADLAFKLDMRAVVDELKNLEDYISEKLIHSSEERDLIRADSNLRVYKKLLEMQATPTEYRRAKFLSDDNGYTETVGILNRLLMNLQGYYEKTGIINAELQSSISTSLNFYRLAGDRDHVFISEALDKLRTEKQSIAILVTGGFHTPNLTEMLRTRNISYISLQPQISHETDHDRYERMLLHQNLSASWKQRVLAQKSSAVSQNAFSMDLLNVVVRDPVEFNQLKLALGASEAQLNRAGPVIDDDAGSVSGEPDAVSGFRKYAGDLKNSASRLAESVKQRIRKYIPGFILDFIGRFTGQKKEESSTTEPEDEKISHLYTEMAAAISEQHHDNDLNRITIDSSFHPDLFAEGLTPKSMRYVFAEILKNAFDEPATGQVRISAEESESRIAIDIDNEGEVDWSALWFTFLDKLTKNRIYVDTDTLDYRVIPASEIPGAAERNIGIAEFFVMLNAHHFASEVSLINGKLELKTGAYESADSDVLEQGIARGDADPDLVKQLISRLSDQQLAEYFEIIPFGLLNQAAAGRMWKSPVSNSLVIVNETPDQPEYIPYSLSSFMVDHAESIPEINILPMIQKVTRAETPVQEKQKRKEYGGMGVGLFVSARLLIGAGGDIQIASLPKGGTRVKIILNKYTPDIQSDDVNSASKEINVELIESEANRYIFKNSESAAKLFEKWPSDKINITVQQDDVRQLAFWVRGTDEKELGVRIQFEQEDGTASIEFFSVQGPVVGEQLGYDAQIKSVGGAERERIHRFLKTNFFPQFTKLLKQNAPGIYRLRISHAKALTNAVDFADYFLDDTEDGGLTFLLGEGNPGARLAGQYQNATPVRKKISEAKLYDQIIVRADSKGADLVYRLHEWGFGYWMGHRMENGQSVSNESDVLITTSVSSAPVKFHNSDIFGDVRFKIGFSDPEAGLTVYTYNGFIEDSEIERIESEGLGTVFRNVPISKMIEVLSLSRQYGVNWDDIRFNNAGNDSTSYTSIPEWAFSALFPASPNQDFSRYVFAVFPQGTFEEQSRQYSPTARIGPESNPTIEYFNNLAKSRNRILEYTTRPDLNLSFRHVLLISDQQEAEILRQGNPANRDEALRMLGRSEEDQQAFESRVLSEISTTGSRLSAEKNNLRIRQISREENIEIPLLKGEELTRRLNGTTVVVMAGGQGTRARVGHKPTYKIGGLSLLERTINGLRALGVDDRNILIVGPQNDNGIKWPQGIEVVRTESDNFHGSAIKAVAHVRDAGKSDQVMILSGDNLFHIKSTAEALYGENKRAVIIGENQGDKGLRVKTDRAGSIKSYDVDYSGDGPYPVGWFIPVSDMESLTEDPVPGIPQIKGLERLLYENHDLFTAPRARYDAALNYSFNLNYPADIQNLSEWTKADPRPYGDLSTLQQSGNVYDTIKTVNLGKASWKEINSQIPKAGILAPLKSAAVWLTVTVSVLSWLSFNAFVLLGSFSGNEFLSLEGYSAGVFMLLTGLLLGLPAAVLSLYTSLNFYLGIRTLVAPVTDAPVELIPDKDLPVLTVVVPIKNEPPDVVRRTIQSAFESGYPEGKLEILLVSGSSPQDRNQEYHAEYQKLINQLDPEGKVLALVEADQSARKNPNSVLANGKSFNLNHVLLNPTGKATRTISGEFFSIADADSYFAADDLRKMMSAVVRQRNESSVETGIIQFRRIVDVKSGTDYGQFFTGMRQNLHDVVLDNFVTPLRFDSGFIGNFGHSNVVLTSAAVDAGGFNEDQKIEDLDMAMKLKEGGYRVLYNNDVSLAEGIALGSSGFYARAGKIARGDVNLFQTWLFRILFSDKFTVTEKIHTLVHLTRGVNTFVLTLLSWTIPAIFIFNGAIAFSGEAYALAVTIFYLTVFPSIYFIHSQPIIVAPVILRLLLAGEFFQAMDLFLSYPRQYVHLLTSGPVMGMTSLKVALTKKIEVFVRTARSNEDPVQMTANVIESAVEKISAVLTVSVLGLTLLYLPSMIAAPVIGVLSVYYLTSVIYTQWIRKYMVKSEKQTPDSGARLTFEVQDDSSDLSDLIISFGKYFDFGPVFGPERQKTEALKKKGLEELFRNTNPQLKKPLLRQFLDTAAPDRRLKDIQKIEFLSKLGEGDFRSSYLIEITVAGQVYRLTAKISAGPELKYRKHQAVSAIARKSHGVSKTFQGVWEMQDGYTVLLRDYYGGSSVKDVYEDAREKKLKLSEDSAERAAIDEKINRMMDHLNETVIELWADTHGMATDFHSANFLTDTDNDLAVRIVDYGLIPTKSTEISRIEFTESGQPVFYNDSNEETEKSFMSVGYSDMRSKFVSAFHEPYPIYLEDENGYEYETVHSIPYDEQKFAESVVRYFSERGDFGVLSDETILETADKVAGFTALVAQFRPDLLNTSNTGGTEDSSVVDSDKLADENAWADSKLIDYLRKSIQESDDDNFRGLVLIDRNSAPDSEVIYYAPITKNGNPNRFDRSVTEFQSRLIQKQALQEPRMFPSVGVVLSKPDSIKTFLWTNFILFDHALDQAGKTSGSLSGRFRVIARDRSEEERITQEITSEYQQITSGTGARLADTENEDDLPDLNNISAINAGKSHYDNSGNFLMVIIPEDQNKPVIKIPRPNNRFDETVASYDLAIERLGGVAADTQKIENTVVNFNNQSIHYPLVFVQERVVPIRAELLSNEGETVQNSLRDVRGVLEEMYARGVHNLDHKIDTAYGRRISDGLVVITDLSHLYSTLDNHYQILMDDDFNMNLYNTSVLRTLAPDISFTSADLDVGNLREVWGSGLDRITRMPADWVHPASLMRREPPSDNESGSRLTTEGSDLQPNQFDQEVIRARRGRITDYLMQHIADAVSGSWPSYISAGLRQGKTKAIPAGTIRNDLMQIGRTDPDAVVAIAEAGIESAFQNPEFSAGLVSTISADAVIETYVSMFRLTENKTAIYDRLREYIRTNIPDFYKETEPDSNEYTYQSQTQASRLAGDFISSSRKYDAASWGGYTSQILNQLTDEERYLFVERVSETFDISSIQGIYADPPVRVQDLAAWARRDPSSVLDIQQNESGTLNLNIQGLYEDEIPAFQRLYDSGTQNQPITVQYDSYDSSGMGYTESTVYRDFFNSVPYNFDGIRRVDQVATRYSLKMILKELYRQGYEVGFKIDSCCWGTADLSRDIVIAAVYPIKGNGLSERQGKRAIRLINYLSGRFKAATGNGADISRPNYSTSGTLKVSGSEWDFTTESFLRRYFATDLPQPDFEVLRPYETTSLYGGEDNVTRDFDHLNRLHSDPQQPRGEGRITDEIERWIAKGVKPDVLVIGAGRGLVPVRLLQRYQDQIQVHAINGPELFSEDLLHSPQTLAYQLRNENLSEAQAEKLMLKIREHYEITDVNQSFGKFENQKFHIILVAQATMQYLDKISVLERMRKHLVKDGVYITDLDIFSVYDRNGSKKIDTQSFFESLSPQYQVFGANFGDAGVMPPEIYASLLFRNTDPDADTSIPLQASSGNSVFITTPGARLASGEEENIVTIEPENQLVDSAKVRALMESLDIPRNKKAVFIGPGNPNLRYGAAMGEYENSSERIRWEFHLLNQGLPVEIYEPGYLSEWYRKTNSPLGSYRQGMKAFRFYQDSDDRPDSAGFISAGAFFSDGPTNISDAVKEKSAQKITQTLALGGYLHLAHYRAVNGEKERSDVWFDVIKNRLAERGRKLVLVAKGHEDEAVPLAHNWEIFRVEPVSGETAARLADVWSDQINRFLNGVVANLGNQIVLAEEAAQIPVELQGDTAIFELTRGTEKSVAVREITEFGFLYAQSPGENQQNIDISEARSAESLRQKLDFLTDDRSTVSARESATDRALFNQAISAVPRIDDKPVVAVVDLSPFKNLTDRDPRFESMVQVFVNAFLRDGHYLRFQGASEERIRAANELAASIASKLKNKNAVSGILKQEDGNPENAFEVVLRKERSRVAEKVRDRVYVSIAEIPDDPHFVAELGSTALLMKTIGESVRFEQDEDVIDSDTVHTGLISAVNILYSTETVIGLNEVLWTLSADSRADNLMIGFIRVDNVIMALRMQSRQIDIMA